MPEPLHLAVIGLGRIGKLHALHAHELAQETGQCRLAAVVDSNPALGQAVAGSIAKDLRVFSSVEELISSGVSNASVIATPTDCHRAHATRLIEAGQRVLLEKPLTGSLAEDREFCEFLDANHPRSLMLAFQRRFDGPLCAARRLIEQGAIGRVFKIVSTMEDSNPAPNGYVSQGILADMSVHNVDEVLWLCGRMPRAAAAIGNCIYSRRLSTAVEDFDDAFLYLWFDGEFSAQVSVSRNHVSGYRVETWIFGEKGHIHAGHFDQKSLQITLEAYGRKQPIHHEGFQMRGYGEGVPEFFERFGPAYKAELAEFVGRCRSGEPFPVTHNDGLRAMEVIDMGMRNLIGR